MSVGKYLKLLSGQANPIDETTPEMAMTRVILELCATGTSRDISHLLDRATTDGDARAVHYLQHLLDLGAEIHAGGGGGGGATAWGAITGTLTDQTDLVAALSAVVTSINTRTGDVTLAKADVGLSNVDNTADSAKPISTAQATALALKVDVLGSVASVAGRTGAVTVTKTDVGLSAVQNLDQTNPANVTQDSTHRFATDAEKATWNAKQAALGYTPEDAANRNVNNGYAGLDSGGKVPVALLPSTVMELKGNWNASTNSPALSDGTGTAGWIYECTTAGATNFGHGAITFAVGDWAVYGANGLWYKSLNSNVVTSVNGQTGTVIVTKSDVGLGSVDNTTDAAKPISTATQTALNAKYDASNPSAYVNAAGAAAAAPVQSVAGRAGVVVLAKADVGLSAVQNVDQTNPANITQDSTHRFSTDAEKTAWNARSFGITVDGQGGVISTGSKGFVVIPFGCTITKWYVVGDVSGSVVVDLKVGGVSLVGTGNKPTLTSAQRANATVSGWTTTGVSANGEVEFNVSSAVSVTRVNLIIEVTPT